jgi:osmoprotectant transport system substrate-binding protein
VRPIRSALALSLVGALTIASCGDDETAATDVPVVSPTVNVGRTNDPLSLLMAEIYGQGMQNSGVRVGRKDPVADQAATYAALQADTTQFVPETTGALMRLLDIEPPATADEQITAINAALPDTLTVTGVTSAVATQVVACNASTIEEHSLKTITDLVKVADKVSLGGTSEFQDDTGFGLAALNTAYDAAFTLVTSDDVAAAIASGDVGCGVVSSLTPAITTEGLLVLEDDKSAAPTDVILGLMTTGAATPEALSVLTQINAGLTTEVLRALLVKLETGTETADEIAKQYIASQAQSQGQP